VSSAGCSPPAGEFSGIASTESGPESVAAPPTVGSIGAPGAGVSTVSAAGGGGGVAGASAGSVIGGGGGAAGAPAGASVGGGGGVVGASVGGTADPDATSLVV